jgi:hypothetical protein
VLTSESPSHLHRREGIPLALSAWQRKLRQGARRGQAVPPPVRQGGPDADEKRSELRAEHAVQAKLDAIAAAILEQREGKSSDAHAALEDAIGMHEEV